MLRKIWRKWLGMAHVIGNVQMVMLLSLVYWLMLMPVAVVLKLVSDPLALRRPHRARWVPRRPTCGTLEAMKNQF